jgi:hypothetical protein
VTGATTSRLSASGSVYHLSLDGMIIVRKRSFLAATLPPQWRAQDAHGFATVDVGQTDVHDHQIDLSRPL